MSSTADIFLSFLIKERGFNKLVIVKCGLIIIIIIIIIIFKFM